MNKKHFLQNARKLQARERVPTVRRNAGAVILAQARALWQVEDWHGLCAKLQTRVLENYAHRAELALLAASAHLQVGSLQKGNNFLKLARQWGCSHMRIAQMLAAGTKHTLARAAQQQTSAVTSSNPAHPFVEADPAFYRAFEERFRGPREPIMQRVAVYLPFVQAIAPHYPHAPVLDLGCGRGEWLQVLQQAGIPAKGVDQDAGMLANNAALGLHITQADLLDYLQQQAPQSLLCISLIHVVEHLPFDVLRTVVHHARRTLVPHGLLIMETPNPENYTVGSCNFYTDPTHRNPLPPPLLAFLPEYFGFERIKTLRLQEDPQLHAQSNYSMADVLGGISPDYSVVAQLQHPKTEPITLTDTDAWNMNYGICMEEMLQIQKAEKLP